MIDREIFTTDKFLVPVASVVVLAVLFVIFTSWQPFRLPDSASKDDSSESTKNDDQNVTARGSEIDGVVKKIAPALTVNSQSTTSTSDLSLQQPSPSSGQTSEPPGSQKPGSEVVLIAADEKAADEKEVRAAYPKDRVVNIQPVRFDATQLRNLWQRARNGEKGIKLELLDRPFRLDTVASVGDRDEQKIESLLFKSTKSSGWLSLAVGEKSDAVTGFALIQGKLYDINPSPAKSTLAAGYQLLVEVRLFSDAPTHLRDTYLFSPESNPTFPIHVGKSAASEKIAYKANADSDACKDAEPVNISRPLTILFGYTKTAARKAAERTQNGGNTSIETLASYVPTSLMTALHDAGVQVEVKAVKTVTVAYDEPPDTDSSDHGQQLLLDSEFNALDAGTHPALAKFKDKRRELGADIAVLIVHNDSSYTCGEARLHADAAHALAVVNWQCMRGVLAAEHEIGHILGLHHEDDQAAIPSYAKGFMYASKQNVGPLTTIMGQPENCNARKDYCTRILKYSNPRDSYDTEDGQRITIGVPGNNDNACMLRQSVRIAVNFCDQLQ